MILYYQEVVDDEFSTHFISREIYKGNDLHAVKELILGRVLSDMELRFLSRALNIYGSDEELKALEALFNTTITIGKNIK